MTYDRSKAIVLDTPMHTLSYYPASEPIYYREEGVGGVTLRPWSESRVECPYCMITTVLVEAANGLCPHCGGGLLDRLT